MNIVTALKLLYPEDKDVQLSVYTSFIVNTEGHLRFSVTL